MIRLQYLDEGNRFFSKGNKLYLNKKLYLSIQKSFFLYFGLLSRLTRNGIHSVKSIDDLLIILIKGKLLFYRDNKKIATLPVLRGNRPLKQGIEIIDKHMYYGDYWGNPMREPVNLYEVCLKTFEQTVLYSFEHCRHIHFVQKDTLNVNVLFIGTGDSDNESGIYSLDITTKKLSVVVKGSQKYRAVSLLQVGNTLIWGSDDPDDDNFIYLFNRDTQELKMVGKIDGPAYYSTKNKKGELFIATTIEDRHRHRAVIYKSSDNGHSWVEFKRFQKDIWDVKYFGYGIIEFVEGQEKYNELYYNLIGLKEK